MSIAMLDTAANDGSMMTLVITMVLTLGLMYFMIYRPQKKQQKKDTEMRNALDIGDEVTTIGGIVGRVVAIKEDTFVLETGSDRMKIRFRRSAIASVEKLDAAVGAMGAMALLLTRVSLPAAAAVPLATLAVCLGPAAAAGCLCAARAKTGWRWGRWWAFCSLACSPQPLRSTAAGM